MADPVVIIEVSDGPFDGVALAARLLDGRTDVGATVTFNGLVRGRTDDDRTDALTLEHYPGMTEQQMEAIAREATQRWPLTGVAVVHRVGRLEPGEPIVQVTTASAHRHAAFESAAFIMDWLKTRAPFWKKETAGGQTQWVDARDSDEAAAARWNE